MKRTCLVLFLIICLLLPSCGQQTAHEAEIFAMDTFMKIQVWGGKDFLSEITTLLRDLDASLSVTSQSSELFALNTQGNATLSSDSLELLEKALSIHERTDGAFDPTVYPYVQAWGFTSDTPSRPDEAVLHLLSPSIGTQNVTIEGNRVLLSNGCMLDFGGIAKGYAAQRCTELLPQGTAALLILGGNVQTVGSKPDGSDWQIGISDPENSSAAIAKLRFQGSMALVTSGNYERCFTENGVHYHHILDPKTGYPADNELASVTVLTQDGTLADALSTALFVMGLDSAISFWRESNDFEAVFICKDGSILATQNAAPMLYDCEFEEITR